jgi:glutamate racemase
MVDLDPTSPIGVFDSGVGGLSVVRAIWQELPDEKVIFLGDQEHVPYGLRSMEEVRAFSDEITRYLLAQGVKIIVVACNAASAAALHHLRRTFVDFPFVGMEPALKPAAEKTHSGVVGVLATPATFQGELYASVVERFASGVTILQHTCPGLVLQIEKGFLDVPETRSILENALHPMLSQGIDTVVLGCTHYPFVIPLIQQIIGPSIRVIDPSPAIARRVGNILQERNLLYAKLTQPKPAWERTSFLTTGDPTLLQAVLPRLLNIHGEVQPVQWEGDRFFGKIPSK